MKTKIEHRSTRSPTGVTNHRSAQPGDSSVDHRPARTLGGGDHRRAGEIVPLPGSTPPLVEHRQAPASAATIDHAEAFNPKSNAKSIVRRPAHFQKAIDLAAAAKPEVEPASEESFAEAGADEGPNESTTEPPPDEGDESTA